MPTADWIKTFAEPASHAGSFVVNLQESWPAATLSIVGAGLTQSEAAVLREADSRSIGELFFQRWEQAVTSNPTTYAQGLRVKVELESGSGDPDHRTVYEFDALGSENGWTVDLFFDDLSFATAFPPDELTTSGRAGPSLDRGAALLQPITVEEFAGIEGLLEWFREQAEGGSLDAEHERVILQIADVIRTTTVGVEPGRTPRWKVVATVASVATYLFEAFPKGLLNWIDLVAKIRELGWLDTAADLLERL